MKGLHAEFSVEGFTRASFFIEMFNPNSKNLLEFIFYTGVWKVQCRLFELKPARVSTCNIYTQIDIHISI